MVQDVMLDQHMEALAWQLVDLVPLEAALDHVPVARMLVLTLAEVRVEGLGEFYSPLEDKVDEFVALAVGQLVFLRSSRPCCTDLLLLELRFIKQRSGTSLDHIDERALIQEEAFLLENAFEEDEGEVRRYEFLHRGHHPVGLVVGFHPQVDAQRLNRHEFLFHHFENQ